MRFSSVQYDLVDMRPRLRQTSRLAERADPLIDLREPSPVTTDVRITKPGPRRATSLTTIFASTAMVALIVGFCAFYLDVGHVAVASIFTMIAYAMIKGTS